jgi:hypothetical protein
MTYQEIMKTCLLIAYKHEIIGKSGFSQWAELWTSKTKLYKAIFTETCTDKPYLILTFELCHNPQK